MPKKIVYQHQLRKEFYNDYPDYAQLVASAKIDNEDIPANVYQAFLSYKSRMLKVKLINKQLHDRTRL